MRRVTVAAVAALLAAVAAGMQMDAVDTLRGNVDVEDSSLDFDGAVNEALQSEAAGASSDALESWPTQGKLKLDGEYYLAIGKSASKDRRDSTSDYVCGMEYHDYYATTISFERTEYHKHQRMYNLKVTNNPSSRRPESWYLTAGRDYSGDSYGDKESSLRLIAQYGRLNGGVWSLVPHPRHAGAEVLELMHTYDRTTSDVRGWYLAISKSPAANRDSSSKFLVVTDRIIEAASVEVV